VPSSCHRDVGSEIFSGKQAIGFADEKGHLPERRYQRKLDHEEATDGEGEENRGGVEVSEPGSCLRVVESVREGLGSEDGMC
jgi:hypothetical protein